MSYTTDRVSMSAHKKKNVSPKVLDFWQPIWRLAVLADFYIYPESVELAANCHRSYLILTATGGRMQQTAASFQDCLAFALKIWATVKQVTNSNCVAEWNYLGNTLEKTRYLDYLDNYFWRNQNQPDLLSRPDYAGLIAETFKISKCVEELGWTLEAPVDHMSAKSREFLLSLEKTLVGWELNPYLINDSLGNLHWTILSQARFLAQGSIYKTEHGFVQTIQLATTGE